MKWKFKIQGRGGSSYRTSYLGYPSNFWYQHFCLLYIPAAANFARWTMKIQPETEHRTEKRGTAKAYCYTSHPDLSIC